VKLPGCEDPHKLRGSMKTCVGTFSWRPAGFFLVGGPGLQAAKKPGSRPGLFGTLVDMTNFPEHTY